MSYRDIQTPISETGDSSDAARAQASRPRLLDEVRNRLRLKHYSLSTERAYLHWIRRHIHANGLRHPRELDGVVVERFLSRLATDDHVAPSTQNQALSALLFLYREVLGIRLPWMENVVRAKRQRRLPVVLSKGETACLLRHLSGREALMAGLLYGGARRVGRPWPINATHPIASCNDRQCFDHLVSLLMCSDGGLKPTLRALQDSLESMATVLRVRSCWRRATTRRFSASPIRS